MVNRHTLQLSGGIFGDDRRLPIGLVDFAVPAGDQDGVHAIVKQLAITLVGCLQPLEQLGVLDGRTGQVANARQHQQGIRIEYAGNGIDGLQDADDTSLGMDRGDRHGAHIEICKMLAAYETLVIAHNRDDHTFALVRHVPGNALPGLDALPHDPFIVLSRGGVEDQIPVGLDERQCDRFHLQRLDGLIQNALEHILHAQAGIDGSCAGRQGGHDARLALALRVKTGVHDCNPGQVGDGLHQAEMFFIVGPRFRVNQR